MFVDKVAKSVNLLVCCFCHNKATKTFYNRQKQNAFNCIKNRQKQYWGRELADMMERRNVEILCLQETKWKGSKARNIGGGCKILYNGADGRKNGIGIVLRRSWLKVSWR